MATATTRTPASTTAHVPPEKAAKNSRPYTLDCGCLLINVIGLGHRPGCSNT